MCGTWDDLAHGVIFYHTLKYASHLHIPHVFANKVRVFKIFKTKKGGKKIPLKISFHVTQEHL